MHNSYRWVYTGTYMISRYLSLKQSAINLRKKGTSIRTIETKLKIPKSTLSGWFKNIKLTKSQLIKLDENQKDALVLARKKAVAWHNAQKTIRIEKAKSEADLTLNRLDIHNNNLLELALAMLYLGEGSKKDMTSLGNTNPLIVKFFINAVKILYNVDKAKIKYDIHLRSDQNKSRAIRYWAKELAVPETQFSAIKDKRPAKSKTYSNYNGVCVARCGKIAIQRKLGFIASEFCNKIAPKDD